MNTHRYPEFVRAFLEAATAKIRDRKLKMEIQDELLSHIDDAVDGATDLEAAYFKAIARFGDPSLLARNLRRAHKPWYLRWTVMVPSFLALTFFASAVAASIYASMQFRGAEERWRSRQSLRNEILQNQRDLKTAEPFFSRVYLSGQNAGEFLNDRLPWRGAGLPENQKVQLSLPESLRSENLTAAADRRGLEEMAERLKVTEFDFRWMKELANFDYWEILSANSHALRYTHTGLSFSGMPVPDFGIVVLWVRLRLLDGYVRRDLVQALAETQKLGELTYSTETLIGTSVGLSIFRQVNRAYEDGIRDGIISRKDWKPLKLPEYDLVKTTAWASGHWLDFFAPNDFKDELFSMQPVLGGCGSLGELGFSISNIRGFAYVDHPVYLEKDLSKYVDEVRRFANTQAPYCRMTLLKLALNNKFQPPEMMGRWADLILATPYLRQGLFAFFMTYATGDWLLAYENYKNRKG